MFLRKFSLQSTLAISTLKGDKEKCAYSECVLITSFVKNHLKNIRVKEILIHAYFSGNLLQWKVNSDKSAS